MSDAEEYASMFLPSGNFTSRVCIIEYLKGYDEWKEKRKGQGIKTNPEALQQWIRGFDASRVEVNRRVDELAERVENHTHKMVKTEGWEAQNVEP